MKFSIGSKIVIKKNYPRESYRGKIATLVKRPADGTFPYYFTLDHIPKHPPAAALANELIKDLL